MQFPVNNVARNVSYLFWTFGEQAATMVIPRLILWPLAAYILGKEAFGIFVTAYAVSFIIGIQPGNGLATGLLRHLSDYNEYQRMQFCRIAMRLCHKAMIIIIAVGLVSVVVIGSSKLVSWRLLNCIIPMTISLYSENQAHLLLTESRFRRHFWQRTMWFTLRSTINLIGGFVGALVAGLVGLAWGFTLGNAVMYVILRLRCQAWFQTDNDEKMAGILKKVWLQITIGGIIVVAGPYLNRLILSGLHGFEDTADLVAATSVMFIFLAPITCVGGLLLSMISKYTSIRELSRWAKVQWLLMLVFGIVACPIALRFFAPHVIRILYPSFGAETTRLLNIVMWMILSETLISLSRPFVMKFGPIRLVPIINGASLSATLIPALCLIPSYGSTGAAWAIVVGSITTGGLWFIGAGWIYFTSPSPADDNS